MKKKERAKLVQALLDEWIPYPEMPLHFKDPFTLLIATILSAQCTDLRVNKIAPHLFAIANTPEQMAKLSPKIIETIIRPCGLAPTKSKAISQISKDIIQFYGGKVPQTVTDLEKLPGVGHKTASVVVMHAFHKCAFPVDTHIFRCAKRWKLSNGHNVAAIERDLKKLFPQKSWGKIHLQIILFARKYCPARGHSISNCPICKAVLQA